MKNKAFSISLLDRVVKEINAACSIKIEEAIGLDGSNNELRGFLFLLFEKEKPEPTLFAKIADGPGLEPILLKEQENLEWLRTALPGHLRELIPQPLWQGCFNGCCVTVRSVLEGETLKNAPPARYFSKKAAHDTFESLSRWLLEFYAASGKVKKSQDHPDLWQQVETEQRYLDTFLLSDTEERVVKEAWSRVKDALAQGLLLVPRHWDLCAANVIVNGGRFGIIDWEMPLEPELPLFDLFYFCSSTRCMGASFIRRQGHFESFKRAYFHNNFFSQAVCEVIFRHARKLKLSPDLIPHLFVAAQTEIAMLKYRTVLMSHCLDPAGFKGGEQSSEEREERWEKIPLKFMDLPMSCIDNGVCLTVRHTAENFSKLAL
ncbi:aminoglycoside phosphotransferase family protein [Acidobacteriota bacterium]